MNLFQVLVSGGWLMLVIGLASLVVIALGVGRYLAIRRYRDELDKFVRRWRSSPAGSDEDAFRAACKGSSDITRDMAAVFERQPQDRADAVEGVEAAGRQGLFLLENGLGTIATLAAVTPLIGFLGTVTGMIRAFMQIQKLGGNVNANVLAGGIWEALVTTAAGLAVGILALVIHNYLAGMVRSAGRLIEAAGEIILRLLWR